jgi:DNA-binding response OmpR family regulator
MLSAFPSSTHSGPTKPETDVRGRILLVDDDPMAGAIVGAWLDEMGYATTYTTSPAEADQRLASASFDLVLSDVRMPGNYQLEWVERLLGRAATPPVLLITGTPDLETACRAANLPVAGYLLKPLDFTLLDPLLQRVLRDQGRRREFIRLAQDIIQVLGARGIAGTAEESALIGRLAGLATCLPVRTVRVAADHPAEEVWRSAITDAIAVIESTKHSFRSKELGRLRQRLRQIVASDQAA